MADIQTIRKSFPQYDDMTDEQFADALHRKYYSDVPIEEFQQKMGVTKPSQDGASYSARMVAGKESDPTRKLEVLKSFYPDAKPYGSDNYVFTDPKTQKPTVYNPSGFDFGDVAGSAREILQAATGIATMPASLTGVGALGSAAAVAGTGQAYDSVADLLAGVPQKPVIDKAKEAAVETGAGYLGGAALGGAMQGVGGFLSPIKAKALDAWKTLDLAPPSVGALTGGHRGWNMLESAAANLVPSASTMTNAADAARAGLKTRVDDIAARAGSGAAPDTVEGIGSYVVNKAKGAKEAFQKEADDAATAFFDGNSNPIWNRIGNSPASLNATLAYVDDLTKNLSPQAAAEAKQSLLNVIGTELSDYRNGGLNIDTLRALRTKLSAMVGENTPLATTMGVDKAKLIGLKDALEKDVVAGLTEPADKAAYESFQGWYSGKKQTLNDLNKFLQGRTEKAVGDRVTSPGVSSSELELLRNALGEDAFKDISSGVIRRMGMTKPGVSGMEPEFSPRSFQTTLNSLTPEARAMFESAIASGDVPAWQALEIAVDGMNKGAKVLNTSNTAGNLNAQNILQGGLLTGAAWNDPVSTLVAASMPYGFAKATTSPTIQQAMANQRYQKILGLLGESIVPTTARVGGEIIGGQFN